MRQEETLEKLTRIHADSALVARYGVKPHQIAQRCFENTDFAETDGSIHERMMFFAERAQSVFQKFYPRHAIPPKHIVHVTCTGYVSPSPAQRLVSDNGWAQTTATTHAYHMGCYAALPAIRMAEGFVAAGTPHVDIVHTEMCALHMNRDERSPEQLVVQSLFADGHIKYSAVPSVEGRKGFRVLKTREQLIPESHSSMSWVPSDRGMKMTLSRKVPNQIAAHLQDFLNQLTDNNQELLHEALFAIHPGGPKIIEAVQETLGLKEAQIAASREILRQRGNMSSATLPHIWKQLTEESHPPQKPVISLAFGPGLTIFGALFETL